MKRILHLLNTNKFSGAEKVAIDLIKNVNSDSIECIYASRKGIIEEKLINEDIPYILVDKVDIKSIKKIIRIVKPDIIHCHDFQMSIKAALCGTKIQIISHIHQNPIWIKNLNIRSILYFLFLKRFCCVISVSQSFFNEYFFSKYINNKIILTNPVNLSEIQKNKIFTADKIYDLVYVGRLSKEKNPIRFLEIISNIKQKIPSINCAIVGDGDLYEECLSFISNHNMENNVKLFGFINDISEVLNKSKIGLNTSCWEGFGLSVVEYLAFGLPVVCANVGGLVELIDDTCGKLCSSNEEFEDEIIQLLSNDQYYFKKSIGANEKAIQLDNVKEYVKEIKKIYDDNV